MSLADYVKKLVPSVASIPKVTSGLLSAEHSVSSSKNAMEELKSLSGSAGHASPNKFKVKFFPPASMLGDIEPALLELIAKYTTNTTVPVQSYLTFDWSSKGHSIKMPYQKTFGELTTNHNADDRGVIRKFFQDWFDLALDSVTHDFNYLEEYAGTVIIEQYSKAHNDALNLKETLVATYVLERAYPSSMGVLTFSHETSDALLPFDITWAYNNLQITKEYGA